MKNLNCLYLIMAVLLTACIGLVFYLDSKPQLPRYAILEDVDLAFHYMIPKGFAEVGESLAEYKDWTVYVHGKSYKINFVFNEFGNRRVIVVRGALSPRVLEKAVVVKGRGI